MLARHEARLNELDRLAAGHHCTYKGKNVVDRIGVRVDDQRFTVTVTRSREGGFMAATSVGDRLMSSWGRTASEAVKQLGSELRSAVGRAH